MSNDPAYNRVYHLNRYHERRSEMLAKLGGKCVVCQTKRKLHIHHKDPTEKSFNFAKGWGRPWLEIEAELAKCELRCEKHHIKVHEAKHGTISRYRGHRCRCEPCRMAWSQAMKRWKRPKV